MRETTHISQDYQARISMTHQDNNSPQGFLSRYSVTIMCLWKQYPVLRHIVRILGVILVLVVALIIKASYDASREFALAEQAYEGQQYAEAVLHYERAIKWYTPLSSTVQQAAARLWNLGTEAEQRGDLALALEAFRGLRGSLYATRSLYLPYEHWIPKSEAKIAVLMAQTADPEEPRPASRSPQEETRRFAEMLQRFTGPNTAGTALAELGFVCWVGATLGFLWFAFTEQGLSGRRGLLWGGTIAAFFAVWIVGMLLA
jgi:tetratricopeptide (TPR) repeat protein